MAQVLAAALVSGQSPLLHPLEQHLRAIEKNYILKFKTSGRLKNFSEMTTFFHGSSKSR